MFAMGKLAALVDRRGLQGNFYCPTPFARRLHAGDIHGCACNTLISMDNCVCDTCRALSSRFQVDFGRISRSKPVMDAPSSIELYRALSPFRGRVVEGALRHP